MPREGSVTIEAAKIVFRNFAGKETMYNAKGKRNFAVLLDDDVANAMGDDGWNVKHLKPRDPDEPLDKQAYLQVEVSWKTKPPKVVMLTSRGRTFLDEDTVELLDWADLANVDLIINPYRWEVGDKTGIKAYLSTMFVTIEEDELELKYANVDDADD